MKGKVCNNMKESNSFDNVCGKKITTMEKDKRSHTGLFGSSKMMSNILEKFWPR